MENMFEMLLFFITLVTVGSVLYLVWVVTSRVLKLFDKIIMEG